MGVTVQSMCIHAPDPYTRGALPVSAAFCPQGVLGGIHGSLLLRFVWQWRSYVGPFFLGPFVHGGSETLPTWEAPMRGPLPLASRPTICDSIQPRPVV